jgi:hypothetical protein
MILHLSVIAAWRLIALVSASTESSVPVQAVGGEQKKHIECASLAGLQRAKVQITEAVAIAVPQKGVTEPGSFACRTR